MNKGGAVEIGPLNVIMTQANYSSGIPNEGRILYGGEAAGHVIRFVDWRPACFAGDTNVFSGVPLIRDLYEPDLCFLQIGERFTMTPRAAAVACQLHQPKQVIPMHWGTFPLLTGTPKLRADMVRRLGTELWELAPGKPVEW